MINHLKLYEELKETIDPSAAKKIAEALKDIYEDLKSDIAREEFRDIKNILAGLSEGLLSFQRTTEENFNKVWASINELAEAQRKTEERLKSLEERFESFERTTEENFNRVWGSINELAEAQRRTEERVNELAEAQRRTEERLNELAEAQRRTEERVNELAEAQRRTEERVNELAEAQRRTEESLESFKRTTEENFNRVWGAINELTEAQKETQEELKALAKGLAETREMVGGLSDTVGYSLEDRAIKSLPSILKNKYGIIITERLVRKFIKYNGRHDEVNIFGTGKKDKRLITIIGEAKSRLSKKHIEELLKLIERLRKAGAIYKEVFPLMVTYSAEPVVEEMAKEKGVNLIWSYEL